MKLDSATYQCVAKSEVGWSVSESYVQVQAKNEYAEGVYPHHKTSAGYTSKDNIVALF